jgi:hypothetical protein
MAQAAVHEAPSLVVAKVHIARHGAASLIRPSVRCSERADMHAGEGG